MSNGSARHAMVTSGGGAYGAYEVGVVKALMTGVSPVSGHQPLEVDILSGTSVGAFNAAFLCSRSEMDDASAAVALERIWLEEIAEGPDTCGNKVLRIRFNPSDFLDPTCVAREPFTLMRNLAVDSAFFAWSSARRSLEFARSRESLTRRVLELFDVSTVVSRDPFRELLRETIDLRVIRESAKKLRIAATDWDNGRVRLFENGDLRDELGHDMILASSSLPGIFPPVKIDGTAYVDGGLLMNTPLKPAIRAGADVIHVVYLDLELSEVTRDPVHSTLETMDRMLELFFSQSVNSEINNALLINQGLDIMEQVLRGAAPTDQQALAFLKVARKIRDQSGRYRPLVIHRYRPRRHLGGLLGMLNFERDRVEALIDQGYRETVEHDCDASGCILPEG